MPHLALHARVVDRLIFNFRVPPEDVASRLPAGLRPAEVDGSAVVSLCVLGLERIGPGLRGPGLWPYGVHCALRAAALERDGTPVVYLTARLTGSTLFSWITRLGWPAAHPRMRARLDGRDGAWAVTLRDPRRRLLFDARATSARTSGSTLFPTDGDFGRFISGGRRSYTPARRAGHFARVDLTKRERGFDALAVSHLLCPMVADWSGPRYALDSAYRTGQAAYGWSYRGQVSARALAGRPRRLARGPRVLQPC